MIKVSTYTHSFSSECYVKISLTKYQNRYTARRTESSIVSKVSFVQTHPSVIVENVT